MQITQIAPYLKPTQPLNHAEKIISLDYFTNHIMVDRSQHKIAQLHGVFDLLHIGHIKHIQQAKEFADIVIVTVTADKYVNKGPGRPYFAENLRAQALAALACVDYVIINYYPTAVEAIAAIKPDFYVKGLEYQDSKNDVTKKIIDEEQAVKDGGGQIRFTDDIVFSSSTLINRFYSSFSPELVSYLEQIKQKYTVDGILHFLENAKNLKVLLIGETIIDIYHYGEAIGKSGKEPVLVTKYNREEMYVGGVLAVANHLGSFCSQVTCMTLLGEQGEHEAFIRKNMKPNVDMIFQYKQNSPTIVKRRYLEEYSSQKLFEIYEIEDSYLEDQQRTDFINALNQKIAEYDVVLVADYGHGMLDHVSVEAIENKAKFLAVNTQSNASNHGFNCISKYKKADYVCIANRELQLNYRQKHISVLEQLQQLVLDFNYRNVVVTTGKSGAYTYKEGEGIFDSPAFTSTVKDRVGAGDAVLAITSLCVAQNAPAEIIGFIGNVVGAEAVNIMGNLSFIEKPALLKHIIHLLK